MINTALLYIRMILHICLLMCHTGTVDLPCRQFSHVVAQQHLIHTLLLISILVRVLLSLCSCAYEIALNAWIAGCSPLWAQEC